MTLTQQEYDYIIRLEKQFNDNSLIDLDSKWSRELCAHATKDTFTLDYYRGSLELKKFTYNKRYRKAIVLIRFDAYGRHTNPDGQRFNGPHIHLYREGYDDKFAFDVKSIGVDETSIDKECVLIKFLNYCNVTSHPEIQRVMF